MIPTPPTIFNLIQQIAHELAPRYKDATLCEQYAWWMLQSILQQDQAHLIAMHSITLTDAQRNQLADWIKKQVVEHMPLQYLLGSVPFNDLDIRVKPPTLIPRPETEEWCSDLIDMLQTAGPQPLQILDLCSGTGCIALALASALPNAQLVGTDIADTALALARENAAHNNIANVTWIQSDLFAQIDKKHQFDLIVSNPPYIAAEEWTTLDDSVKKWEDTRALIAQEHGLHIIKQIIDQAPHYLRNNNPLQAHNIPQVWIEIGYQQGASVAELMKAAGYTHVSIQKDMEGKDRVVKGSKTYVATHKIV